MENTNWIQEFPGAVTVCDREGILLEMNAAAVEAFAEQGGARLIGANLLDCHPEPSRSKLQHLLETQQRNVYTIEKQGVRKLVYQTPWYRDGQYAGMVELVLELPAQIPNFVRDPGMQERPS